MPAEHALLGLIVLEHGEAYGYELAHHFETGRPLGDVLRLEQAMLYQYLKKLERQGWVTGSLQPQGSRPPRQVYRLTPAGSAELRRWLEAPVARTREIRLEFLVKLFFARALDPDLAGRLVSEQLTMFRQHVASLESQVEALHGAREGETEPRERDFQRMVLDLRQAQTRAAIGWLESLAATTNQASAEAT
jgi:DNA-binding PadR family transcriptional regulator